jgi:hypothetical protein
MLVPRSSPLSPGAIAGAVIGSVVGALLIAFCLFPFIVRARRRRLARHDDPGLAEMGQGPGGPIFNPQDLDDSSYKRSSGSGPETALVHDAPPPTDPDQKPQTTLPQGVTVEHGLPSPVSSPASPTDPSSHADGQAVSPLTAAVPAPSPTESASKSNYAPRGTVSRESTRDLSVTDSYGPPSRELTGITAVGITEEPESFDDPSGSPEHGHFPHLRESLRGLIHGRRSTHQRRDSKRSTLAGTDGARSPSVITNDVAPQPEPEQPPSALEIDVETPGLAWDYYHDPNLGIELSNAYAQSTPTPTSAGIVPPALAPTSAPVGTGPSSVSRPITEEADAISPDSDATATPGFFSRQNTFFHGKSFPEPLQHTGSFPIPTIVADLPSPPLLQYSTGPSGNPMEMMKPTNPTESAWMLEHEMRMIQNSPPAPEPLPLTPMPADEVFDRMFDSDMKASFPQYQPHQSPYHSPPSAPSDPGMQFHEEPIGYYNTNAPTASDYSTPPHSTGPSTENTPDTRLTDYTSSPSPPAETEAPVTIHLMPSPDLSAGLSPPPALSPSPGLSPAPSPGRSSVPSPGASPGRPPARPPGGFKCDTCGLVKATYHELNHHQRYHKKPWPCEYCDLRFGTVTHKNRHVNDKHVKTRKFYCTQAGCDYARGGPKSFPRKDNWKRHMMKKHSIDPKNVTDEDHLGEDVAMDGA